jgi:hypothetical protein
MTDFTAERSIDLNKGPHPKQATFENKMICNPSNTQTPELQSASKLYRPSDRRLSAKLMPTLADRGCRVVSATNPQGR